ncbi:MAG: 5-(carboxyamino)imidazole ribonucleotide mutase [Firmicutes bacterium]|jgi:phosphoribosylaminoimidazole carboxylase PurE protein|nr:5-(carboxyamino)imidazole ribonucleotide mutase [Bacillota bacterium]
MECPIVGVVMGSKSDLDIMARAVETLSSLGIACEARVISAHRTPDAASEYARTARERGIRVIIAGAGLAAHLAGALASNTVVPVIGVPISSGTLGGLDALLSTVMMPPGVPVATVAVGGAENAAILAAEILALENPDLSERLLRRRAEMAEKVREADLEVSMQNK